MPLQAVCIELRPNLCSGHVFLQFEHDLGDTNKTRVVIREHDVHIVEENGVDKSENEKNELVVRLAGFGVDIQKISVFLASGQHVSFRFNYTQINHEALHKAGNLQAEPKPRPLLLSFGEHVDQVSLHCSNCLYELVASCGYRRLREFPSGLIDPSEFFCHNHGTTSKQTTAGTAGKAGTNSLVPGPTDLYYGLNHVVLNMSIVHTKLINSGGHLYCKRCMQMLGLAILEDAAAKLWADALRWLPTKSVDAERPLPRQLFQHATVTQLMLRLLSDLWTQSLPQFCPGSSRALLVATMPNRRQQYMLIHVLERQLAVLRRIPPAARAMLGLDDELHYFRACKLYYRVFDHSLDDLEQQMDLPRLAISPSLFVELQTRFNRNSQLIPRVWRYNSVEEKLLLTYFFYENEQLEQLQQQQQQQLQQPKSQQLQLHKQQTTNKKPTTSSAQTQTKKKLELQLEQEEYETDAGLDASFDEDEEDDENDEEHDDGNEADSDDEHSDTDSESKSSLLHKSTPIMLYEQNLVKRWLTQQQKEHQTSADSNY